VTEATLTALAARLDALEKALNREVALICKLGEERDSRYTERWEAQTRETDLARAGISDRLEGMNQIREQLSMQAATFLTREAGELMVAKALSEAQGGTSNAAAQLAADLARLGSANTDTERRVTDLERRLNLGAGKDAGTLSVRALLFSVIAAAGATVGIAVSLVHFFGG
jgi:chromosome segregation ATPase